MTVVGGYFLDSEMPSYGSDYDEQDGDNDYWLSYFRRMGMLPFKTTTYCVVPDTSHQGRAGVSGKENSTGHRS